MTRTDFMIRLKRGLGGLPLKTQDEILADYDAHFDAGAEAGRSEAEVAAALGDPDRLARELRVEGGARRWEAERNPSSAAAAVFAVLGLGAIDIIILLPILMGVVANTNPELWGAVVADVPFVDVLATMLDPTLPLTPGEWPEWGNPIIDKAAFDTIRS